MECKRRRKQEESESERHESMLYMMEMMVGKGSAKQISKNYIYLKTFQNFNKKRICF